MSTLKNQAYKVKIMKEIYTNMNLPLEEIELELDRELNKESTDVEVICFLLEQIKEPDILSNYLESIYTKASIATLRLLDKKYENPKIEYENNPLIVAIINNDMEKVNYFMDRGDSVNYKDINGDIPLIEAVKCGYLNMVEFFIGKGADVNINNSISMTPLHYAAKSNFMDIARFLVTNDALVDIEDGDSLTPLLYAVQESNRDMIKFLIEKGADVKFVTSNGKTALHYAYDKDDDKVTKLLLDNGAKEDSLYDKELTFLEHAKGRNSKKWFRELIVKDNPHNPKELGDILHQFSKDKRLKYSNHPWDSSEMQQGRELTYKNFHKDLVEGWDDIENDLTTYAPTLSRDIKSFLFDNVNEENLFGRKINYGWSSKKVQQAKLAGASQNNKPEDVDGFQDSINIFKKSFVIKEDEKESRLLKRFLHIKKVSDFKLKIDLDDLKKKRSFKIFTDVPRLEQALIAILKEISDYGPEKSVKVTLSKENFHDKKTVVLRIIHKDSSSTKSAKELASAIEDNGGRFETIYSNLRSVCDWSIDTICGDEKRYKIDYLYPKIDEDERHITQINDPLEGFTYILRFYL
jgi:ankyrin repeat protein